MAILIANIGTSDLAIQLPIVGENYYLPIDFLPDEPNLKEQQAALTPERSIIWKDQRKYIEGEHLYQELGFEVGVKQTSRKLTEVLFNQYQANPDYWHPRLMPVRIGGAIKKAISLGAKKAYIFVTDQQSDNQPEGHQKDTIYLFDILDKWLKEEGWEFSLEWKIIPADIPGNDQDRMLGYYYQALNEISKAEGIDQTSSEEELVLISTKGGTNQMKMALQIQTMAASFKNPIFLSPDLSIDGILDGKLSDCNLFSYWRYRRSQKYQTVKKLLNRWDFDGGIQILKDWVETLDYLITQGIEVQTVSDNKSDIELVIKAMEIGLYCFNLDISGAQKLIKRKEKDNLGVVAEIKDKYYKWLNLYTQCRIYWELNLIANFLSRMTSFCEETLHKLMGELGKKYFDQNKPNNWVLNRDIVDEKIVDYLVSKETFNNEELKCWKDKQKGYRDYKLKNRFRKRNFVDALIQFRENSKEIELWQTILQSFKKLDYWVEKRNYMIHSAKGVSKARMSEILDKDREAGSENALVACDSNQILEEIMTINRLTCQLLNKPETSFVDLNGRYYIYSDVKDFVIKKLMTDCLE
ncbi:hypothetical protein [Moorena sp. SIO4G3]|uniref:hypothetical protein n=1 Tax=Moorena sp. SIO4G3 TaxID=2607821 RepID=UPI0014295061|nr:hypothetical protein [Moorena sp. SIO4G3]NEO75658.1 hypothetical protein [Moorena sp. SIO4G3]